MSIKIPHAPPVQPALSFKPDSPWLAPLAGYSDLPFRLLCRSYGAAVRETEMLSAKSLLYQNPGAERLLATIPEDSPLVIQLFGSAPDDLYEAVLLLRSHGWRYFDFNMGCPVRKVMRQKAGAALLDDPALAISIGQAMLEAASATGPNLPREAAQVGFKTRQSPNTFAIVGALEEAGASCITFHPRTAAQGYSGKANHVLTQELVKACAMPIIASGDIMDADAGLACLEATGAATVMFARGALRNPAIFTEHKTLFGGGVPEPMTPEKLYAMIKRHMELTKAHAPDSFRKARSVIPRYARDMRGVHELRLALCQAETWEELELVVEGFFH